MRPAHGSARLEALEGRFREPEDALFVVYDQHLDRHAILLGQKSLADIRWLPAGWTDRVYKFSR